ncbi:MAG: DUF4493 domain-containing protein [Bacteroidaceae bacterium]|nr:DUF4493 domain-containing protein [Bacteroidaceae bacterium]
MKRIHLYIYSILLCGLFAGCAADEVMPGMGERQLTLVLRDDAAVVTRATPAELGKPVAEMFNVRIVNQRGTVAYDGPFKEQIKMYDGDYTVTATFGEDVYLGIDKPYYKGEATFSLTVADPNPQVSVPCRVANALASVVYLDKNGNETQDYFDEFFSEYRVCVTRGDKSVDIIDPRQSAYFSAGATPKFTFVATLMGTHHEVTYELDDVPATLGAADHLCLKLSITPTAEGFALYLDKAEVERVTVNETIPLEWLPKPKTTFTGAAALSRFEGDEAPTDHAYTISTSHYLQDIEIDARFADSRLAPLNGKRMLSTYSDAERALLATYGVVFPEIGTVCSDFKVNLSGLVSGLRTNDGTITENHLGLRVRANNRWDTETASSMDVKVMSLRFTLPDQIEGDAWTKTLYITPVTAANVVASEGVDVSEVLGGIFYEVSTDDGKTWSKVSTTTEGAKLMTTLNSGTTYKLRAGYSSTTLHSNVATQTMETPTVIPNGDFEDLQTTYSGYQINVGGKYNIWPKDYQNTATFTIQEPTGWASVNAKTCNLSASMVNTWYVNPSTYNTGISWQAVQDMWGVKETNPTPFKNLSAQNGGNAMVLRNVAWDSNGPSIATSGGAFNTTYYGENVPNVAQRSSGKLFLGSYSYSGGTETYNEGVAHGARPTKLSGYYKYAQDGDTSEYGTVTIILLNGSKELGRGTANLTTAADYTQFAVSLTYSDTTLHPTSMRVMFTSSRYASYTQSSETANVKTTTYNNIRESMMRGAILTIDNLSLTYDK